MLLTFLLFRVFTAGDLATMLFSLNLDHYSVSGLFTDGMKRQLEQFFSFVLQYHWWTVLGLGIDDGGSNRCSACCWWGSCYSFGF